MEQVKVIVITQARMGSTRFPGKVLKCIHGRSLLQIHVERIQSAKKINKVIVATTTELADNPIVEFCSAMKIDCFRGSETDVLDRFYQTALLHNPTHVVRVTSDCPLIDPEIIDAVTAFCVEQDLDYCSNTLIENYPDGVDVEIMKFSALESAWRLSSKTYEREHVTPYIRENSSFYGKPQFKSANYPCVGNYGMVRLTVDESKDFEVVSALIDSLGDNRGWKDYADFYLSNPVIQNLNSSIKRNEGFIKK